MRRDWEDDTLSERSLLGCAERLHYIDVDPAEFSDLLMRELGDQLTQTEAAHAERWWGMQ
jgi:hypothetical protein